MRRGYEYHSSSYYGGDRTDEYGLDSITRMQRMLSKIPDFPHFPHVHEVLHNNSMYAEEHKDHQKKTSHKNHLKKIFHRNHHKHQTPKLLKKVHYVEQEQTTKDGRDGKREVYQDKNIDMEADRFIQQKRDDFELCNWDNFRVY
ncbi:hypothetical protein Pfo_020800 [Paulownia fortunei]|nr:hypothetical protein Pfo_020800 [Paulownia fortunei]